MSVRSGGLPTNQPIQDITARDIPILVIPCLLRAFLYSLFVPALVFGGGWGAPLAATILFFAHCDQRLGQFKWMEYEAHNVSVEIIGGGMVLLLCTPSQQSSLPTTLLWLGAGVAHFCTHRQLAKIGKLQLWASQAAAGALLVLHVSLCAARAVPPSVGECLLFAGRACVYAVLATIDAFLVIGQCQRAEFDKSPVLRYGAVLFAATSALEFSICALVCGGAQAVRLFVLDNGAPPQPAATTQAYHSYQPAPSPPSPPPPSDDHPLFNNNNIQHHSILPTHASVQAGVFAKALPSILNGNTAAQLPVLPTLALTSLTAIQTANAASAYDTMDVKEAFRLAKERYQAGHAGMSPSLGTKNA